MMARVRGCPRDVCCLLLMSYETCYEVDTIKVNDAAITGTTFTMGAGNTTVEVKFKEKHQLILVNGLEPTCNDDGYKPYYKCSECGKLFSDADGKHEITSADTVIPATGHSLEKIAAVAATCTSDGNIEFWKCSKCGALFKDSEGTERIKAENTVIAALGHKLKHIDEKAPTKTEPGHYEHYKCDREGCEKLFKDANGKQPVTKEQIIIPAMGHDLTHVPAKAATCTEAGNTEYYICKDDECKCGKVYNDPYGLHEISIEDTAKPALGHDPKEEAGKEANCTEDGYEKYYKCSRCHKLFSDAKGENEIEKPVVITKLGHDMIHIDAEKPTHEEDGHIAYYHCNRCGKNFKDFDGNTELTDAQIVDPHIGAAVLGEVISDGDFKYKITNPRTDGTGTVTIIGIENEKESVVIPDSVELKLDSYNVTRIGNKAFYKNTTIKSVSIGANITIIDSYAFYGCSNLSKVSGGSRLQIISSYAFAYCPKLSSFNIPSYALKKIGYYAFKKDSRLKTIYIRNTTRLTKSGVKKSLKGSSIKTVKVKKSKVKKYKKYFTKKNCGRKVKVKK